MPAQTTQPRAAASTSAAPAAPATRSSTVDQSAIFAALIEADSRTPSARSGTIPASQPLPPTQPPTTTVAGPSTSASPDQSTFFAALLESGSQSPSARSESDNTRQQL